jgi:hypothetical protein
MFVAVHTLRMAIRKQENRCAAFPAHEVTSVHSQVIPAIQSPACNAVAHSKFISAGHPDDALKDGSNVIDLIAGTHCSQSFCDLLDFASVLFCFG